MSKRLECFGNPDSSDTCWQCKDNTECCGEERKKHGKEFEKETVCDEKSGTKIVSLKPIDEKAKTLTCYKCGGFGSYTVDDQKNQKTCDICLGSGQITVVLLDFTKQEQAEEIESLKEKHRRELEGLKREIKEKSEGYARIVARLHEQVIDLTLKEQELKQKLRELFVEIENLRRHNHYAAELDKWLVPQRQLFALEKQAKKLEGLLG